MLAQPPANGWDPSGIGDEGWSCRWVGGAWVAGVSGLSEPGYNGGRWRGGVWVGGGIKGLFLFCACKLIMLDAFDLGVLGELGASRFPGPKRVRAKDAKDAKVRKAIAGLSFDYIGWRACGVAGVSGLGEPGHNGGGR